MRTRALILVTLLISLVTSFLVLAPAIAQTSPSDVLISEYVEGSSFNKAIEIYNGTGSAVDLTGYSLRIYFNGSTAPGNTVELSGSVADGDVFVVADDGADAAILDQADQTDSGNFFNGDDAVVLFDGEHVVDSFGQVGTDPGSQWDGGGQDDALQRKASVCAGDTDQSDPFDASVEWDAFPADAFSDLGDHTTSCGGGDDGGAGVDQCDPDADLTVIAEVQGDGASSPLATGDPIFSEGETVTVEAVVTVADADLEGVFIQEEAADQDDDAVTSEGVFVYTGSTTAGAVEPAQTVQVTGAVTEDFTRTQIGSESNGAASVTICDVSPITIDPVELPLPSDDAARESYEGMLITAEDLVVSGSFDAYSFGELITGYQELLSSPTDVAPSGAASDAVRADNLARELRIDNRSSEAFINQRLDYADDDLRLGATTAVTGVLDHSFSNWKVQYSETPVIDDIPADAVPTLTGGNDVVGFNVLNYFNTFGSSDTLRGARNQEQFDIQSAKVVDAIIQMDAAVVGLVEIENDYEDGYDDDLATVPSAQTLVAELNDVAGDGAYDWIRVPEDQLTTDGLGGGGLGTDAIAVGLVYQPERATPVGQAATFDIDQDLYTDPGKNRWPIAQTFDVDGELFTAVVNHFKSKGSSCDQVGSSGTPSFAPGEDVDDDSTGACDLTRRYAANELLDWLATDPTGSGDDDVLLLGDYNSYAEEQPIQIITDAGYTDLVATQDDDAFTYKFSGRVGRLDYAFSSPSLGPRVSDTEVWQINSRAQYADLYYIDPIDMTSAEGSSDHDPVVVALDPVAAQQPPMADAGGRYEVRVGRTTTLDATGSTDPNGDPLTFTWDFDDDGLFDDATGPTPVFAGRGRPPGTYPVAVQVNDGNGGSDVAETVVDVVTPGRG